YCRSLTSLDLSGFRTDNVTGMGWMFGDCSGLTSLNLTGFKTDYVSRMDYMFSGCSGLTTIYAGDGWSTAKVTYGEGMFSGCTSLVGGTGTPYDASHIDYTYAQIDGGSDNPGYFTRKGGSGEWPEGDLNHDGKVDASDVVTLVNMIISRK
ncbi:MAG: BspA family leucine-rich repeat surface protein, partial [Prevotella sp.]|nr:BspA family leucine-rich repeat surface protein [Prevotella sp.]